MKAPYPSRTSDPDDIQNLVRQMGRTKLQYIDISGNETRARAYQRWPLLAELSGNTSQSCEPGSGSPPPGKGTARK